MKTEQRPGVRYGLKIAIALASSLLGLALLPVLALPYDSLDWLQYEPAYQESRSAPRAPLPSVAAPAIPCAELPAQGEMLAAEVDGQAIGQQAFERELAQFLQAWESLGHDPESAEGQAAMPALRRQVLELLINNVLVQQAAVEQGITLSKEEVQAHLAEEVFQGGGPEPFQAWLQATDQTWEEFERDVCQDLLRQAVRESVTAGFTATADPPPDPTTRNALQAAAFEQWLAKRRGAARIELYVDIDP
jgi:hypothetical protein